jgi:hypothetical protein
MTHVDTPLVHTFGNSVLFGDNLGALPILAQPILFYPDWYFMAWPFHLILAFATNNHDHPYFHDIGFGVWAWGAFYFLLGIVFMLSGLSETINEFFTPKWFPASQNYIQNMQQKGAIGQLVVLPLVLLNVVAFVVFRLVGALLYFHMAIALVVTSIVSLGGAIGLKLTNIIYVICMVAMLAPPMITMVCSTIATINLLF